MGAEKSKFSKLSADYSTLNSIGDDNKALKEKYKLLEIEKEEQTQMAEKYSKEAQIMNEQCSNIRNQLDQKEMQIAELLKQSRETSDVEIQNMKTALLAYESDKEKEKIILADKNSQLLKLNEELKLSQEQVTRLVGDVEAEKSQFSKLSADYSTLNSIGDDNKALKEKYKLLEIE